MDELRAQLKQFVLERDWEQYHSPKNLAIGLAVEASELLEVFIWLSDDDSRTLNDRQLLQLKEELGDILLYLINLADKFSLDPVQCAQEKLELNRTKYPADLVRGSARKYTEY
jgi:NTP pyrophosphatase (non-canonical NTP hydrolase)